MGFILNKVRAIAVQFPADLHEQTDIVDYNINNSKRDPRLPKVINGVADKTGIAGNHNNIFLRMVLQRITIESCCSEDQGGSTPCMNIA